eukprot:gene3471-59436_t
MPTGCGGCGPRGCIAVPRVTGGGTRRNTQKARPR